MLRLDGTGEPIFPPSPRTLCTPESSPWDRRQDWSVDSLYYPATVPSFNIILNATSHWDKRHPRWNEPHQIAEEGRMSLAPLALKSPAVLGLAIVLLGLVMWGWWAFLGRRDNHPQVGKSPASLTEELDDENPVREASRI
jgi:hypothetical protein